MSPVRITDDHTALSAHECACAYLHALSTYYPIEPESDHDSEDTAC